MKSSRHTHAGVGRSRCLSSTRYRQPRSGLHPTHTLFAAAEHFEESIGAVDGRSASVAVVGSEGSSVVAYAVVVDLLGADLDSVVDRVAVGVVPLGLELVIAIIGSVDFAGAAVDVAAAAIAVEVAVAGAVAAAFVVLVVLVLALVE